MQRITIHARPLPKERLEEELRRRSVAVNDYARQFFAHAAFDTGSFPQEVHLALLPLRELGLTDGATLPEIFARLPGFGLKPCRPAAGLFLRLEWADQPESKNAVLTGTHRSPQAAVTVLSEPLEADERFPKGLYLRKVEGVLWLRGYVCSDEHRWSPDDVFALEL